ncbi:VG15 protein [Salininema proteolyticum]|uniref:Uncharacterized protein n=1 Tax=Salininema proteolyticum TaxID=1607685 RepID=A0ABV8TTI9_9ACTN
MATPPHRPSREALAEADWATEAFRAALMTLGARAFLGATHVWRGVDGTFGSAAQRLWARQVAVIIGNAGTIALRLAIAYIQLLRALLTGRTIMVERWPDRSVTLGQLRDRFASLSGGRRYAAPDREPDGTSISLDRIEEIDQAMRDRREAHWRQIRAALDRIDAESEAAERASAAEVERIVLNDGRGAIEDVVKRDDLAQGWVRLSRSGTPCSFCAMLISRADAYNSEQAAGFVVSPKANRNVGELYHNNCDCYAVPVYHRAQLDSARFDHVRHYQAMWSEVLDGLRYTDKPLVWRWFVDATRDADPSDARAAWRKFLANNPKKREKLNKLRA